MIGGMMGGGIPAGVVGAMGALSGNLGPSDFYGGWETVSRDGMLGHESPEANRGRIGGVSSPEGSGGVGGGPAWQQPSEPTPPRVTSSVPDPVLPQFQINPNQVQNDIALGSGWGGSYGMPQMNPFSMYGNQSPFNWGGYLNTFGGK